MLQERRNALAFWFGSALVTLGVILHLPMYWMGRNMGFRLVGMPMDTGMLAGMGLIALGVIVAGYGLLPGQAPPIKDDAVRRLVPPEDAPLTAPHWMLMTVLAAALVIDIMKPASLGFVLPGMRAEYGVSQATVAWFPFSALIGTVVGSFVWGALADLYGRRATILLSSVMFIGTAICGAMPSLWWNVGMCFLMGIAAGGMLPVAYALLAELMPTKHRGWSLVLVGGIGAVGGYFAASALSSVLQPVFSWRIMWFLNLPTGLIMIALSPLLPESARFLQHMGRMDEAREVLAKFGTVAVTAKETEEEKHDFSHLPPVSHEYFGTTIALTVTALMWSLVNFGLLLWLPSALVAEGNSVGLTSAIIARSTLIAAPTILLATYLYSAWSTKGALMTMIVTTTAGLVALLLRESHTIAFLESPILPLVLIIVGSTGVISMLLPYAAESYPLKVRGRATGWIAGWSKLGGLMAQGLATLAVIPAIGTAAGGIAGLCVLSLGLIAVFGHETRGRDLRQLEGLTERA